MYNPTHRFDTSAETAPPDDPTVAWSHELQGAVREVAVWNESVYIAAGERILTTDKHGNLHWAFESHWSVRSSPAVVDGTVYVGIDDVHALDAATGREQWAFETDSMVHSVTVVDGIIYIGSEDGIVYALDGSGTELSGKAEQTESKTQIHHACSRCGADLSDHDPLNFCPECGAKQ